MVDFMWAIFRFNGEILNFSPLIHVLVYRRQTPFSDCLHNVSMFHNYCFYSLKVLLLMIMAAQSLLGKKSQREDQSYGKQDMIGGTLVWHLNQEQK